MFHIQTLIVPTCSTKLSLALTFPRTRLTLSSTAGDFTGSSKTPTRPWILKNLDIQIHTEALICFEHTGLYSISLAAYLDEVKVPFWMIPALQIKRSLGITRGKTDRIDARRIAEHAYLHRDSLTVTKLPSRGHT